MTTKQIGMWLSISMAIVAAAAQGSLHLPMGIPTSWAPIIQSWALFILSIYTIVNMFLPSDVVVKPAEPTPVAPK